MQENIKLNLGYASKPIEGYIDDEAIKNQHWFGTYSYSVDNRWNYLISSIFGPQNSEGQFHKNAYTNPKIKAMMKYLNFDIVEISRFNWKEVLICQNL